MNHPDKPVANPSKAQVAIAAVGACALLAEGVAELLGARYFVAVPYRAVELMLASGLLLSLAGVALLHDSVAPRSRFGRTAFALFATGCATIGAVAAASAVAGRDVLAPLFALGALCLVAGSLSIGIVSLRSRGRLRAAGVALPVVLLTAFSISSGGLTLLGVYWLIVAGAGAIALRSPNRNVRRAAMAISGS